MEQADAAFYADAEGGVFGRFLDFLNRLDGAHIFYTLVHTRLGSVMVDISLPGWRTAASGWSFGELASSSGFRVPGVVCVLEGEEPCQRTRA